MSLLRTYLKYLGIVFVLFLAIGVIVYCEIRAVVGVHHIVWGIAFAVLAALFIAAVVMAIERD